MAVDFLDDVQDQPEPATVGSSVQFLPANPRRVCFTLAVSPDTVGVHIWPAQQQANYGLSIPDGAGAIHVHRAMYPTTCQRGWFYWAPAACNLVLHEITETDLLR